MKRLFIFLLVISCAGFIFAQDIIVTKAGTNIEEVTVKSITNSEIIYVLNGEETTLPRAEVAAILYSDGRYEEFRTITPVPTEQVPVSDDVSETKKIAKENKKREAEERKRAEEAAEVEAKAAAAEQERMEKEQARLAKEQKKLEEEERKRAEEAAEAEAKAAAEEKARMEAEEARFAQEREYQDGLIHKIYPNKYYFVDNYYSKKEIQSLIINQCPDAQQYYNNAKKWIIGGWCGTAAGLVMLITGSVLTGIGIEKETNPQSYWVDTYSYINEWGLTTTVYGHYETIYDQSAFTSLTLPGIIFLTVGSAGMVTSTVFAAIGHHRMNSLYEFYNESCSAKKESALSLNFGVSQNGIGLTLHF